MRFPCLLLIHQEEWHLSLCGVTAQAAATTCEILGVTPYLAAVNSTPKRRFMHLSNTLIKVSQIPATFFTVRRPSARPFYPPKQLKPISNVSV
jgi:hypothetical protein